MFSVPLKKNSHSMLLYFSNSFQHIFFSFTYLFTNPSNFLKINFKVLHCDFRKMRTPGDVDFFDKRVAPGSCEEVALLALVRVIENSGQILRRRINGPGSRWLRKLAVTFLLLLHRYVFRHMRYVILVRNTFEWQT